ncbi:MAG: amidohydrolase, partial [Alistipes sp.]|nr:amidohydrolase [Alistipes sp.]
MDSLEFRRHLHRHPELSFAEHETARFIASALDECGIAHRTIASTGVLARIEGRGDLRRAVVLRADIDALPVHEATGLEYASQNEGVMHACGHDIHAAVLFGTLQRLSAAPDFEGTVFGLFQPGEECNPGGASLVLAENPFEGYDVRAVIGEHTDSALDVGTFGFREGKYMAASDELRFTVRGRGGHAAMRGTIRDAVQAQAALVLGVLALNRPDLIVSIGRVEADGTTNVIPDQVRMEGTLRTFSDDDRRTTKERIRETAAQT